MHVRDAAGAASKLGAIYPTNRAHLFRFWRLRLHSWLFCSTLVFSQPAGGASQFAGGHLVPTFLLISTPASSAA
jgi:uncharacterized membrane protein